MLAEDRVRAFGVWKLFVTALEQISLMSTLSWIGKPTQVWTCSSEKANLSFWGCFLLPGIFGQFFFWQADVGLLFWRFSGSGGFSYEQLEAALKEERSAASEHLLLRGLPAQPLNLPGFHGHESES